MKRRTFIGAFAGATIGLTHTHLLGKQTQNSEETLEQQLAGPQAGPWRRLFLDATVMESQQGLERIFYSAQKHPMNPIIVADRNWEGTSAITGPYVYGTVFHNAGKFRIWYQVLYQGNHVGYAESEDGIHWNKPTLDRISFQNVKTNLVVSAFDPSATGGGFCHNPSVVERPNEADGSKRFALYGYDGQHGGPTVAFSPDGLKWNYRKDPDGNRLFPSSDVVSFFYDPYQSRYFATWKTRNRRGRAVGIASSKDGTDWTKPYDGPLFSADDLDPSGTQIYGMPSFPYQGLYIGIPWIYEAEYFRYGQYSVDKLHEAQQDSPRTMYPQLAWSWDMAQWTRPSKRSPFIELGKKGSWDGGVIVTARAPIIVDDKLYFYYGGCDKPHDEKRASGAIGLATLRLDGFCSMQASDKSGWLITRREPMLEPGLVINARVFNGGSIQAELLDRKNRVVPGFSRAECNPFTGDSVRANLAWQSNQFDEKSKRKDYKIRFFLDRAELYSYLPTKLDPNEPDLARFQSTGP